MAVEVHDKGLRGAVVLLEDVDVVLKSIGTELDDARRRVELAKSGGELATDDLDVDVPSVNAVMRKGSCTPHQTLVMKIPGLTSHIAGCR